MKEFRKGKGVTERYTSLEALRESFGLEPVKTRTDNEEKLKAQREKFLGKCRACKQTLTWVTGTSICACKNPNCKGVKMTGQNEDGTENVWYVPYTRTLDEKGMEIANNLFAD